MTNRNLGGFFLYRRPSLFLGYRSARWAWQVDYMAGRWRPFAHDRCARGVLDLGPLGMFRAGGL